MLLPSEMVRDIYYTSAIYIDISFHACSYSILILFSFLSLPVSSCEFFSFFSFLFFFLSLLPLYLSQGRPASSSKPFSPTIGSNKLSEIRGRYWFPQNFHFFFFGWKNKFRRHIDRCLFLNYTSAS